MKRGNLTKNRNERRKINAQKPEGNEKDYQTISNSWRKR